MTDSLSPDKTWGHNMRRAAEPGLGTGVWWLGVWGEGSGQLVGGSPQQS